MLTGKNSIIEQSVNAKEKTLKASEEEIIQLAIASALAEGYGTLNKTNLQTAINNEFENKIISGDENNGPWYLQGDINNYEISKNGKLNINLESGLYNESNDLIKSWQDLISDGIIEVNNGILSTPSDTNTATGILSSNGNYISASKDLLEGKLILDSSVTQINDAAFFYCDKLTNVVLPSSITNIENDAFNYCLALSSITIPNNLQKIGKEAFANTSITDISIADNCTIDDKAFNSCSHLSNVIIGNNVNIGNNAFINSSLKNLIVGENSSIGSSAFSSCPNLTDVTIKSNTQIGMGAFREAAEKVTVKNKNVNWKNIFSNSLFLYTKNE